MERSKSYRMSNFLEKGSMYLALKLLSFCVRRNLWGFTFNKSVVLCVHQKESRVRSFSITQVTVKNTASLMTRDSGPLPEDLKKSETHYQQCCGSVLDVLRLNVAVLRHAINVGISLKSSLGKWSKKRANYPKSTFLLFAEPNSRSRE